MLFFSCIFVANFCIDFEFPVLVSQEGKKTWSDAKYFFTIFTIFTRLPEQWKLKWLTRFNRLSLSFDERPWNDFLIFFSFQIPHWNCLKFQKKLNSHTRLILLDDFEVRTQNCASRRLIFLLLSAIIAHIYEYLSHRIKKKLKKCISSVHNVH